MSQPDVLRASFFFVGLFLFFALGLMFSYREIKLKSFRWINNLVLTFLNSFLLKLIFPWALFSLALDLEKNSFGLLHHLNTPKTVNLIFTILFLDFCIYVQHVLTHKVPILWRLHRVHHSDTDFDTTTALRFHPLEILLSYGFKLTLVYSLGLSAWGVVIFEMTLNLCAMFNHSNFSLPKGVERFLVPFLVTPDMHRVHHSVLKKETDSNYGFCLSIWDRLFQTYIARPKNDPQTMPIGAGVFEKKQDQRLDQLLLQPFKKH